MTPGHWPRLADDPALLPVFTLSLLMMADDAVNALTSLTRLLRVRWSHRTGRPSPEGHAARR